MSSLYAAAALAAAGLSAAGYELGTGRLVPTVAAVLGLLSVVLGARALVRSRRTGTGDGSLRAAMAVLAGLVGAGIGGLHAANVAGGVGTGNGLAGALVGVVSGIVGLALGALALTRFRSVRRDPIRRGPGAGKP